MIVNISGRKVEVTPNLMDRFAMWRDPEAAIKRITARAHLALGGGYDSADTTKRENQRGKVAERDADSAILPDLKSLREDSQNMLRNSPIAGAAINTNVTKVVGTGLKVKSQLDRDALNLTDKQADAWERKAEREFRLATETREIDIERRLNFAQIQAICFLKMLEDGDLLVNMPRIARAGSPYKLKLQMIEAARVNNPDSKPDSKTLCAGVEKDGNGATVKYHVSNMHPGNFRTRLNHKLTWQGLNAFDKNGNPLCLFLIDPTRPGQTRGVPYLSSVLSLIKQLGRYSNAEVAAAVVSGLMAVFVTTEDGNPLIGSASEVVDPYDTTGMELGHGSVIGLTPGATVTSVAPGRPNVAFEAFVKAVLVQIGARLEIPAGVMMKQFDKSYSASRAELEEFASYCLRRRELLVQTLTQPVYEAIITEAVATGRLQAPGFFVDPLIRKAWLGSQWTGDAFSQLDPLKEINAAIKRIDLTISTIDEECRRFTGTPWEDKLPQILKERAILRKNGIIISAFEQANAELEEAETAPDDEVTE